MNRKTQQIQTENIGRISISVDNYLDYFSIVTYNI